MSAGKRNGAGKFAGDPAKENFYVWRQKEDNTCGAACLKMLEHWVNGESQDEEHWCIAAKIRPKGILPKPMKTVLGQLPLLVTDVSKADVEQWRDGIRIPRLDPETVYLLHTDCYSLDGRNYGHWIILLDLFPSIETASGRNEQLLAWYADPLEPDEDDEPGEPVVWPWTSLLHTEIRAGFCLKK